MMEIKINPEWLCKRCYHEGTEEEKYRMLFGNVICQIMINRQWCSCCYSKRFQQDFDNKWTRLVEIKSLIN